MWNYVLSLESEESKSMEESSEEMMEKNTTTPESESESIEVFDSNEKVILSDSTTATALPIT